MIDFCILGSGIAGSTVANLLSKKYSVHDKDNKFKNGEIVSIQENIPISKTKKWIVIN